MFMKSRQEIERILGREVEFIGKDVFREDVKLDIMFYEVFQKSLDLLR